MRYYLAIDIGASSGRHIVGWLEKGVLKTEEVYRFPNGVTELDGHLTWDIDALTEHVRTGVDKALERFGRIESLSVDTWGVDYVLLKGEEEVRPCYAYRDSRTEAVIPLVHEKMAFSELYRHTGIQFQPFNTIYQLYADKLAGRLEGVRSSMRWTCPKCCFIRCSSRELGLGTTRESRFASARPTTPVRRWRGSTWRKTRPISLPAPGACWA